VRHDETFPQLTKRLKMPKPTPTTAVGERLLRHEGPEALSMMLAFQQTFGARCCTTKTPRAKSAPCPSWATDEDAP
jgi:hypothetical protein